VNKELPKITTVVPTFVTDDYPYHLIARALRSLISQSYLPGEIIISDNSQDLAGIAIAKVILKDLQGVHIKYLDSREHLGISKNSNYGKSFAQGDVIHILHQDDALLGNDLYLNVALAFLQNQNFDWLVCGRFIDGVQIKPWVDENFLLGFNSIGGPSCIFVKKNCYIDYREDLNFYLDVFLYDQIIESYGLPFLMQNGFIEINLMYGRVSNVLGDEGKLEDLRILINENFINPNMISRKLLIKQRGLIQVSKLLLKAKRKHYRKDCSSKTKWNFFLDEATIKLLQSSKKYLPLFVKRFLVGFNKIFK